MCVVTSQASTVEVLYRGQLEYLASAGFGISVVCAPTAGWERIESRGFRFHPLPMRRRITPLADVAAAVRLHAWLRRERFDLVQACTPKGALIGNAAARLARVPLNIHLLRGLAYERQPPLRRWLLKTAARLPCRLAHHVIAVGNELRQRAVADGLCAADKISVLHHGSSNGLDLARYSLDRLAERDAVRDRLAIPRDAPVVGFVGRLVVDKGVVELADAFRRLAARVAGVHLLLVGSYEAHALPPPRVVGFLRGHPAVRHVEWQSDPIPFFAAMDALALPSYREGFNNVALEAAALTRPAVVTDATGCGEGTLHEVTGLRVPVGDSAALADALERLLRDPDLRQRMGAAGRRHVEERYDCRALWPHYVRTYRRLFEAVAPSLAAQLDICVQ